MKVLKSALVMIESELLELQELISNGQDLLQHCKCEILYQLGILCQNYLRRAFLNNLTLLKTPALAALRANYVTYTLEAFSIRAEIRVETLILKPKPPHLVRLT